MADKQPDPKTLKMVLFGKTGAGKSASGNTILGERRFVSKLSSSSVTTERSEGKRILGEQELIVVDTPGLFNTKCEQKEMMMELAHFLLSVVAEQMPDAFLFVIKCGSFPKEVAKSIQIFKEVFDGATEHTIVLFTKGEEKEVKAFIEDKNNEDLAKFINECNGGYQVFNNTIKDEKQVVDLVKKINSMVKKNGKPYSSSRLKNAMEAIDALEKQPEVQSGMKKLEEYIDKGLDSLPPIPFLNEFLGFLQKKTYEICQDL